MLLTGECGFGASQQGLLFVEDDVLLRRESVSSILPMPWHVARTRLHRLESGGRDLRVLRSVLPRLRDCEVYGDKIYADAELVERLAHEQNVRLYTP